MAATTEKLSPNKMVRFALFAQADLAAGGFRSLGPAGGFRDATALHFLKLECVRCGEQTINDVGLYSLAHDAQACSARHGARGVRASCFPTCNNGAHLVRKCPNCKLLGSVELTGAGDSIGVGEQALVIYITVMGYKVLAYYPGPGWGGQQ